MGDNAQSIFVEASYRPIRGMVIKLSYTNDTKYNAYDYLRGGSAAEKAAGGIGTTLSQKPFNKPIFRNDVVALDGIYEVHPNMYVRINLTYNSARGYDNTSSEVTSEITGTAQDYLNRYCPVYWQGKNFTAMAGFSFGF